MFQVAFNFERGRQLDLLVETAKTEAFEPLRSGSVGERGYFSSDAHSIQRVRVLIVVMTVMPIRIGHDHLSLQVPQGNSRRVGCNARRNGRHSRDERDAEKIDENGESLPADLLGKQKAG